jgi:hypothetical protein
MVVGMDWTPQSMNWAEGLRMRVMHGNCNNNANQCTYAQVRGPPPLETTIDDTTGIGSIHFANITEEQLITVRVWEDGSPNYLYKQPFNVYFHLFYWEPAPEAHSALPQ